MPFALIAAGMRLRMGAVAATPQMIAPLTPRAPGMRFS
jgi:hypothetical protein